jgi:RNA polymerase sigma-54 factor
MPEMRFEQLQKQTQKLIMSPQMQQAIHLLQLPLMELNTLIEQEMVENPILEETSQEEANSSEQTESTENNDEEILPATEGDSELDFDKEFDTLSRLDDEWREYFQQSSSYNKISDDEDNRRQYYESSITPKETLEEHLLKQLNIATTNDSQRKTGELIIGSIDNNGFLGISPEEIHETSQCPEHEFEAVLKIIQSFHPVGVGARSLSECLLLQLIRLGKGSSLEAAIVRDFIGELGHKNYSLIAGKLSVNVNDIQKAAEMISTLEPRPGQIFDQEEPVYVIPDILVEKIGDEFVITMNNEKTPRLRISNLYKTLMKEKGLESATKEYIREKVQAGKWLVRNIQQRQQTIYNIAEELVRRQSSFLENGISHLRPLTMQEVASSVGIHESTVSRAIANKYMDTPQGLFQIKFFFSTSIATQTGGTISALNVKEMVKILIKKENPQKPLSDQKIIQLLSEQGIDLARRTVAKYRKELHILPSNLRKKF